MRATDDEMIDDLMKENDRLKAETDSLRSERDLYREASAGRAAKHPDADQRVGEDG